MPVLMSVLMHGTSVPRVVKSTRESRSSRPPKRGGVVVPLSSDQPHQKTKVERQGANSSPLPPAVQAAFDAVAKALEEASNIVVEAGAAESADITRRFQMVLKDQEASFDTQHRADQERIADLEAAASGAGDESWLNHSNSEELRATLAVVEAERDAAVAQAAHVRELDHVRLASAEAQVEILKAAAVNQSAEVSRLHEECKGLEEAAARSAELHTENVRLSDRVNVLVGQVARQDLFILDMNGRHEAERAAIRAEYERELADERERSAAREARLLALMGAPVGSKYEGERG
ncbi:hypothetical protein AB7M17_006011 [Bradyrhizobium sp. USDA 377]